MIGMHSLDSEIDSIFNSEKRPDKQYAIIL